MELPVGISITSGRDSPCVHEFVNDLQQHAGKVQHIAHVCMDMSAALAKGVHEALPQAVIRDDRFHVVALANTAMDDVRRSAIKPDSTLVRQALNSQDQQTLKSLMWTLRRNPQSWTKRQTQCMHSLQRSHLKSARA